MGHLSLFLLILLPFRCSSSLHINRMSLSVVTAAATENWSHIKAYVCQARGKNYCLIHKRYFDISWCPECGKMS
ncbi:hypothetical protein FB192DRAFT_1353469 [Mucor lusitanicus]|uniref:Secreted protein n=1 Tax=Mucor circinelloides f. lusitanicus TaxID=29924 RepID=A0A8H4F5E6_MUCCL|nr:hypothetical protein FB192DRAFT_1353469 [Mucor lusitanicus]